MVAIEKRDYLTVAEAARELNVSPSTVWRWIAAHQLPAYRVGARKIRIRKADLGQVLRPVHATTDPPAASPNEAMTIAQWHARKPPTEEELARRHEIVQRTLENRKHRSIAPLTSADLIRQVREEREERYRSWLSDSAADEPSS